MIGMNALGSNGRLGNQMFQYASLKGIARNNGHNFCIPNHNEIFDDGIGNIISKLKAKGIYENTIIYFLSDNGGRSSIPIGPEQKIPRNFPLRGGKGSMYEGGLRVLSLIHISEPTRPY